MMVLLYCLLALTSFAYANWSESSSVNVFSNSVKLEASFMPIVLGVYNSNVMSRRIPFSISPNGQYAWLSFADADAMSIYALRINPQTFQNEGSPIKIDGFEAAGIIAFDDGGFAIFSQKNYTNAVAYDTPFVARYTSLGKIKWETRVAQTWGIGSVTNVPNKPLIPPLDGTYSMWTGCFNAGDGSQPDMEGQIAYSVNSNSLGVFYRSTLIYNQVGWAQHLGDVQVYLDVDTGNPITSPWGLGSGQRCPHNWGVAFAAADEIPFPSACLNDDGLLLLQGLDPKAENIMNKVSQELAGMFFPNQAFGITSSNWNNIVQFGTSEKYLMCWTHRVYATTARNIACEILTNKGTASGNMIELMDLSEEFDYSAVHIGLLTDTTMVVTYWKLTAAKRCNNAGPCAGTYVGTGFQLIDINGNLLGQPFFSSNLLVSGDMVHVDNKVCFPSIMPDAFALLTKDTYMFMGNIAFVNQSVTNQLHETVDTISFACILLGDLSSESIQTGRTIQSAGFTTAPITKQTPLVFTKIITEVATTIMTVKTIQTV